MEAIQLELNLDNLEGNELTFSQMQKQIDDACESMGKVRRKMFAELGEVKKLVNLLQIENNELKEQLKNLKKEKNNWSYQHNGYLFSLSENKQSNRISLIL